MSILRAPASMLFSTNSFTTEAGRSTTSPAATWLATISGTMINVTQDAAQQLRRLLAEQKQNASKGLRVQITKGGCSGLHYELTLDEKKTGDAVVERDGVQF